MKIILFSDTHLTAASLDNRENAHPLAAAIAHANCHHNDAEFAIFLGDLSQAGSTEEYRKLSGELEKLELVSHLMLGNHDNRENFINVFGSNNLDNNGFLQMAPQSSELQFILLDTNSSDINKGELDTGRLTWLERQLQLAHRPCCICMHHQPVATGLPAYDKIGLHSPELINLVEQYQAKIHMILHGHCHMAMSGSLNGVPLIGIKSLCHQAKANFLDDRFLNSDHQEISYSILLSNGSNSTVHTVAL